MKNIMLAVAMLVLLSFAEKLMAKSPTDTTPRLLLYGISDEPFTPTDTVTGCYRRSGDRVYIKAIDGRNIFAAWVIEYKTSNKGELR